MEYHLSRKVHQNKRYYLTIRCKKNLRKECNTTTCTMMLVDPPVLYQIFSKVNFKKHQTKHSSNSNSTPMTVSLWIRAPWSRDTRVCIMTVPTLVLPVEPQRRKETKLIVPKYRTQQPLTHHNATTVQAQGFIQERLSMQLK